MKVNDILQQLADFVNNQHSTDEQDTAVVQVNDEGKELAQQPDDIMIPPLQQKIELLKKAVGVENVYDEDQESVAMAEEEVAQPTAEEEDELARMKRAAGIPVAVVAELSDDEPLED